MFSTSKIVLSERPTLWYLGYFACALLLAIWPEYESGCNILSFFRAHSRQLVQITNHSVIGSLTNFKNKLSWGNILVWLNTGKPSSLPQLKIARGAMWSVSVAQDQKRPWTEIFRILHVHELCSIFYSLLQPFFLLSALLLHYFKSFSRFSCDIY